MLLDISTAPPFVKVMEMQYNSMRNFNYLIVDFLNQISVVVDPAWQIEKLDQALEDTNSVLQGVLLTHSHYDHIHLARRVAEKYNCAIWMSQQEIRFSGFDAQGLQPINERLLSLGNLQIEPILTPGHTPGSICYRIGTNVFTGDVLFAEGCGMCPDMTAAGQMFDSLEKLKSRLTPADKIYPGHTYGKAPGQSFDDLLQNNIYLQFKNKEMFTSFLLRRRVKPVRA